MHLHFAQRDSAWRQRFRAALTPGPCGRDRRRRRRIDRSWIHGRNEGAPLSCVRDLILNLVSDGQNDKIMNIVWTAGDREFRNAFQPPPGAGSGWVSNLHLAKAMLGWIALSPRQLSADRKHRDNALKVVFERRLGIDMARDIARAETDTLLSATIPGLQSTLVSMTAGCLGGPQG